MSIIILFIYTVGHEQLITLLSGADHKYNQPWSFIILQPRVD